MTTTPIDATWARRLNDAGEWGLRHWLLFANSLWLLYAGLPWLAPLARAAGYERVGQLLFLLYTPLCHQLPERSFSVYGYQVAYCHRCAALYTSILAAGLLFGALRRRIASLPLRAAGLLLLPMLLDGGTHLVDDGLGLGLRGGGDGVGSLNFALRMITSGLVGAAVLLVVYPRLERELCRAAPSVSGRGLGRA
jgi:uncharacterized membrane protein